MLLNNQQVTEDVKEEILKIPKKKTHMEIKQYISK